MEAARHILEAAGHNVTELRVASEVFKWLRIHRAEIVVVDLTVDGESGAANTELLAVLRQTPDIDILALIRARGGCLQVRSLFQNHRLTHFLAVGGNGDIDPIALTVTVAKILTRDIFGSARYLAASASEWTARVRSSVERNAVGEAAWAFATQSQCHPEIVRAFTTAVGELVNNALYNAPTDHAGKPRFSHLSRTTPVTLDEPEEMFLRLSCDGRRLCVSASDPFGSLRSAQVMDCLSRCFAKGGDQVSMEEGGASIGLYIIFNFVHHLIINIEPQRRTEVIGIIDVTRSYREYTRRSRSFNLFVARDL
jgi:hypothetical protein